MRTDTIPPVKSIEGIIVDFLSSNKGPSELEKRLGHGSRRAAVKDGDPITRQAAETLIEEGQLEKVYPMDGFVVEITKESLWKAMGQLSRRGSDNIEKGYRLIITESYHAVVS